jgi:hypothetical protein
MEHRVLRKLIRYQLELRHRFTMSSCLMQEEVELLDKTSLRVQLPDTMPHILAGVIVDAFIGQYSDHASPRDWKMCTCEPFYIRYNRDRRLVHNNRFFDQIT